MADFYLIIGQKVSSGSSGGEGSHDRPSASYRSGTFNSNTVNSKFHLIRSLFEIFARFLSFHV